MALIYCDYYIDLILFNGSVKNVPLSQSSSAGIQSELKIHKLTLNINQQRQLCSKQLKKSLRNNM